MDATTIIAPVRYAAWLSGDLGRTLTKDLTAALAHLPACRVERLPRAFRVTADEEAGIVLEATRAAMSGLEAAVALRYPVFHQEMGPVWTGALQAVFNPVTMVVA